MSIAALNPHPSHLSHRSHDAFEDTVRNACAPVTFILAAIQGADAARDDAAIGGITDNPYTLDTQAARDWYAGYNFQMNRELQT